MSTVHTSLPAGNLDTWPASLHPERGERTYDAARRTSFAWVGGLLTRSGVPRWARIRTCGAPVPLWRVDGEISWQHHWCRDRACYACGRSRSRKLAQQLRDAMATREGRPLYFVTLTRPRTAGETVADAWKRFQASWEALRHTGEWSASIVGGLRAMEVTWSEGHERAKHRIPGWHVHAHIIVELDEAATSSVPCPSCAGTGRRREAKGLRCKSCSSATVKGDGTMPAGVAAVLERWAAIVGGHVRAQCGVELDTTNVGQLAKYLTKMFELTPDKARQVYQAAESKHIVQGFGTWARWKRWASVETTPHGWFSCSTKLVDIEASAPGSTVRFFARGRAVEIARDDPMAKGTNYAPHILVAEVPRELVMRALQRDGRPVWERIDEVAHNHLELCTRVRSIVDCIDRQEHPHHFQCGKDPPTWEH